MPTRLYTPPIFHGSKITFKAKYVNTAARAMRPILTWGEESEGVKIRNGVIGSVVGWRLVGDGVALALVVAVPVCVDGVGLAGFAEVPRATTTRTPTNTNTTHIIATLRIMQLTS
jgi:hypothetical protein